MMSYEFYKIMHFLGILTMFSVVGGIALHALNGGSRQENVGRALIAMLHGTALVLILVGGFGMMARLDMMSMGWPGWLIGKLVVWALLAFFGMLPYRRPALAKPALIAWPIVGGVAAFLAVAKPF